MSTTSTDANTSGETRGPDAIVVWAIIGAVFLGYVAYLMIAWMSSPDFARVLPVTPVPEAIRQKIDRLQISTTVITLFFCYWWIVRPKLKTGRLTLVGLFMLAHATTFVDDPLQNYTSVHIAWNPYAFNMGSWANFIPGYNTPNQHQLPESFFLSIIPYIWFNAVLSVGFVWLWKKLAARLPQGNLSKLFVIAMLFVLGMLVDIVCENDFIHSEGYSYVGAIRAVSIWGPGTHYQLPLYIPVLNGLVLVAFSTILYYRNGLGESWPERGLSRLDLSERARTCVRFLAITGAVHVLNLLFMWIPFQFLSMNGDGAPPDTPRYLTEHLCDGDGTPHPCNGGGYIARRKH